MTAEQGYYSVERLRSSLIAFGAGRAISALTSFAIFVLLAKTLPVTEYGYYLTLQAVVELVLLYSSLGVPWVAIRFIPEYRLRASARRLRRFLSGLVLANLLPLVAVLLLMGRTSDTWIGWLALDGASAVVLPFLFVCLFDGVSRLLSALVLEPLMAQRSAQSIQILRNIAFLVPLVHAFATGPRSSIERVFQIEVLAAAIAACLSIALSLRAAASMPGRAGDEDWPPPPLQALAGLAWYNYSSNAVANLYSPAALQLIANAALGPSAAALFGFARGLGAQVRRYLPSELLLSLLRPMLVARYSEDGDHRRLNRRMLLAAKWNSVAVAPLIGILFAAGPPAIALIGDTELQDAFWLVVVLLVVAFTQSHRNLLGLYVNCVQQTDIWLRASLICLLVLPLTWLAILAGWGLGSIAIAMAAEEVLLTITVLRLLRSRGFPYSLAIPGLGRIAFAALVCSLAALLALHLIGATALAAAALIGGIAFIVTLAVLGLLDPSEQRLINQLADRVIFPQGRAMPLAANDPNKTAT